MPEVVDAGVEVRNPEDLGLEQQGQCLLDLDRRRGDVERPHARQLQRGRQVDRQSAAESSSTGEVSMPGSDAGAGWQRATAGTPAAGTGGGTRRAGDVRVWRPAGRDVRAPGSPGADCSGESARADPHQAA